MPTVDDTTPLGPAWLSHHHAGDAERCVAVGRFHVCRRCLAMFAGFIPAVLVLRGSFVPQPGDIGLVLAMAAFAAYEFVQVLRGRLTYSARRVLVVSPFVGVVLAWLGVTGMRDGLGPAHVVLGLVALALLGVLVSHSTLVHRSSQRPERSPAGSGARSASGAPASSRQRFEARTAP